MILLIWRGGWRAPTHIPEPPHWDDLVPYEREAFCAVAALAAEQRPQDPTGEIEHLAEQCATLLRENERLRSRLVQSQNLSGEGLQRFVDEMLAGADPRPSDREAALQEMDELIEHLDNDESWLWDEEWVPVVRRSLARSAALSANPEDSGRALTAEERPLVEAALRASSELVAPIPPAPPIKRAEEGK